MRRREFVVALCGAAACRQGRPRLNVFNWSDYVAPETLPAFEVEFGVRIRYGTYESGEEMLAKVFSGNSGWDVVFPSNSLVEPMRAQGLLAPLRHAWLPNLDNLEESFRRPTWDPNLDWCVPYMWGGTGIVYRREVAPPPAGWASLWEERLRGRLTMLDDPAEVLGACLMKLGCSVNSTDPDELRRAGEEARAQKPLLRAYVNAEVRDQLVAGDVLAAQLWATASLQAMEETAELAFVWPAEGFPLYADNAVILRESERGELAHRFIDYLLRPEAAAAVVKATKTATANARARDLLPERLRLNPTLYPPPEVLRRGEWFTALPAAAQRLRDRIWTEVRSA